MFEKNFARNYEKKICTWNIRRLVNETIVPLTQCIILKIVGFLYHKVINFMKNYTNAFKQDKLYHIHVYMLSSFCQKWYPNDKMFFHSLWLSVNIFSYQLLPRKRKLSPYMTPQEKIDKQTLPRRSPTLSDNYCQELRYKYRIVASSNTCY